MSSRTLTAPISQSVEKRAHNSEVLGSSPSRRTNLKLNAMSNNRQVGGDHYERLAIQPTEYAHANGLGFIEGNIVKYVSRHRYKGGREDLLKALHYLNELLEREYPSDNVQYNVR